MLLVNMHNPPDSIGKFILSLNETKDFYRYYDPATGDTFWVEKFNFENTFTDELTEAWLFQHGRARRYNE
jgi:hypothetical protein